MVGTIRGRMDRVIAIHILDKAMPGIKDKGIKFRALGDGELRTDLAA